MNNVDALAALVHQIEELSLLVSDSRLTWSGEALEQSLAVYSLAKLRSKTEADLKPVVDMLSPVFVVTRTRKAPAPAAQEHGAGAAK